jgi:hypothetical protein
LTPPLDQRTIGTDHFQGSEGDQIGITLPALVAGFFLSSQAVAPGRTRLPASEPSQLRHHCGGAAAGRAKITVEWATVRHCDIRKQL